jgi:hypothetical protein
MRYGECYGTNWNCLGIYSGSSSTDFIYLSTETIYVFCVDLQSSSASLGGSAISHIMRSPQASHSFSLT